MRGNHLDNRPTAAALGSIPAYAGEPLTAAECIRIRMVYPRVCGGTPPPPAANALSAGLSPRMRGNLAALGSEFEADGSIPAYAGEPPPRATARCGKWVYPRVCGGTLFLNARIAFGEGLSPRMRGNRPTPAGRGGPRRSIPAYAGEPRRAAVARCGHQVYPRVCGGTPYDPGPVPNNDGLSPRMRGNQAPAVRPARAIRSIPAYAGEPLRARLCW